MKNICQSFPITSQEFDLLNKSFGKLCYYAAHQLQKKNCKNNYTDDFDDINQELQLSIIRAGSYYKRQIYIEKCFETISQYNMDFFLNKIVKNLQDLWQNFATSLASSLRFYSRKNPYYTEILFRNTSRYIFVVYNKTLPL